MHAASYTGLWWVPNAPEVRLSGRLETSVGEPPQLSLVGSLAPMQEITQRNSYPVIQGFTEKGKRITLLHCQTSNHSVNAPGFMTQDVIASAALIGAHFDSPESVVATVCYADFTYLSEWLGPGAFEDDIDDSRDSVYIRYSRRALPAVPVADSTVELSSGWKIQGDRIRSRGIEATHSFKVSWVRHLEEVVEQRLAPLQDLLTLATDHPNRLTRLSFRSENAETNRPNDLIEAVFAVTEPQSPRRTPTTHDMLFAYPVIEDVYEGLLGGWFGVHSQYRDVCALYFTVRRQSTAPLEVSFLNLVRAVEVFDRIRNGNSVQPKAAHRAFVRTIMDAVPEQARTWLRDKLAFSNEPSLRQRITRLLDDVGDVMDPIVGERESFIKSTADTRNYYTHYSAALRTRAASGKDLFQLNQRLSVLVAALLLRATDLSEARVTDLFRANQHYIWLMRQAAGLED